MTEELEKKKPRLQPMEILNQMKSDAPVFVGFSPRGPVNEVFEVKRWGQFIVKFGSFKKCGYLATSANGFFLNGGSRFYMLNLDERPNDPEEVQKRFREGLKLLDDLEDIPFIVVPGEDDPPIHEILGSYASSRGTYALLDGPEELVERVAEIPEEGEIEGEPIGEEGENINESSVQETAPTNESDEHLEEISEPIEEEKYENMPKIEGENSIVIFPWIYQKDRVQGDFYIPPTGHIAGLLSKLYGTGERPEFLNIEGTILLRYKFSNEDIEKYKDRGINFLRYPNKNPGLILEEKV